MCPIESLEFDRIDKPLKWWEVPVSERVPADDELFALCAVCPHATLVRCKEDESYTVERTNFENTCLDCVVNSIYEAREEAAAEAAAESFV